MAVETFDLSADFKLDDILEEKQNENDNNFKGWSQDHRPPLKKASAGEIGETRKILKKIGHRKSEEEIKKTSELIIQISRFRDSSRFSNFLNSLGFNLNPTHLKSLDIGELEDLLTELKCAIQNKNGSKVLDEGYFMALSMLENITKHPRFKIYMDLNGLSANARQNDELLDTLETLNLIYCDFGTMSVEKKLLFLTGGLILRTSSVNKMLTNIKNYEEQLKNQVEHGQQSGQTNQVISKDQTIQSSVNFNINQVSLGTEPKVIEKETTTTNTEISEVLQPPLKNIIPENVINFDIQK
jgi:hypothetical protein